MKSQKGPKVSGYTSDTEDVIRKPAKLEPVRKSGKDKITFHGKFDDDVDELDEDFGYRKRESVLDYFDDGDDDEI